jgi:hypothetical protein
VVYVFIAQLMTNHMTEKKTNVLVGVYMGCGDMEDGGVEIGDEEGSAEGEEPELTAEEQAAEDEWRAAEAKRAKIRAQGRLRAERYRENHPEKVKERNDAHYYKNRYEIRAQQNERNAQLRLARGAAAAAAAADASNGSSSAAGAGAGGLHFGVLPGCRGMCSPAMCSGCLSMLRAGRHPVRQMCNEAYVIEAQEEKQLPVDAQEEAAFRARLAASLCAAGCRVLETDLRKPTCEFWGTCRQCHAVEHRKRDLFSAQGAFYAAHREEVDESHRQAHARWKEWLDSWSSSFGSGPQAGAARRAAIMQELSALITARS